MSHLGLGRNQCVFRSWLLRMLELVLGSKPHLTLPGGPVPAGSAWRCSWPSREKAQFYHHSLGTEVQMNASVCVHQPLGGDPSWVAIGEPGLCSLRFIPRWITCLFCICSLGFVLWPQSVLLTHGFVVYVAWKVVLFKTEDVCLLFSNKYFQWLYFWRLPLTYSVSFVLGPLLIIS